MSQGHLGVRSGVALVISNMVGAGVFVSAGFMAQSLSPRDILLAWIVGAALALCGAKTYAQVALWVGESGGEFKILSELLHPFAGYLAGWASILVGFAGPIAINALAAAAFAKTLRADVPEIATAVAIVGLLTVTHLAGLRSSKWTHNALVIVDAFLLLGFAAAGLFFGSNAWPQASATISSTFPVEAFATSLFFVSFAFSGWNAAIYIASEFRDPQRDVPRAMILGCSLVAALYLVVNWVFITNLSRADFDASLVYETTRVTLGHVVMRNLLGPSAGLLMSALAFIALVAGASAMMMVGPRVFSSMAHEGYLPRVLRVTTGAPPRLAVLTQGAIAILLVTTRSIQQALGSVGALLTFFTALVSLALLRTAFQGTRSAPSKLTIACAIVHLIASSAILWFGLRTTPASAWLPVVCAVAIAATHYAVARRRT